MDVSETVLERKSIRAFSSKPVPRKVLERVFEKARWAPSWGNTQPWKFTIVGGATLERIKDEYVERFMKDISPTPDYPMPVEFSEVQTSRYQKLGKGLFMALGIGREDREKRNAYYKNMMRCLGAPQIIYLHLDRGFNPYALMDAGIIVQTIALLAVEEGLDTCFLAQSVRYPDVVRRHSGIEKDQMLLMGMAIGHPIENHPANVFRSERENSPKFLRFVDID